MRDKIQLDLEQILQSTHGHAKKMEVKVEKEKFTFACPVCGDSEKDVSRKRAHVLFNRAEPYFHCHHECGSMSMSKFFGHFGVKYVDDVFDFFSGPIKVKQKYTYDPKLMALSEISRLSKHIIEVMRAFRLQNIKPGDDAYKYLESRDLLHVAQYMAYSPSMRRLIIFNTLDEPHYEKQWDETGSKLWRSCQIVGFQARDITGQDKTKYLTYSLEKIVGKCGGIWNPKRGCEDYIRLMAGTYYSTHVNPHKPILVVEGPIDALLLPNCMALTGASKTNKKLDLNPNAQYIFDNDSTGKRKSTELWTRHPNTNKVFDWAGISNAYGTDTIKDINDLWSHCKRSGLEFPDLNKYFL